MTTEEQALEKWGVKNQSLKLIEEMAELTQAICKEHQYSANNLAEEMADVQIVLDQLKIAYPEWINWHQIKLNKLKERL